MSYTYLQEFTFKQKNMYNSAMKKCTKCHAMKPTESFGAARDSRLKKPGLKSWCKLCESAYQKALYRQNPQKAKERAKNYRERYSEKYKKIRKENRKEIYITESSRRYGISKEQVRELLARSVCEICNGTHRLSIDHCHTTNIVRGLLCNDCNNMLGKAKDSMETLKNAIGYLKKCTTF